MEDVYLRSNCPTKLTVLDVVKEVYFHTRVLVTKETSHSPHFFHSVPRSELFCTGQNIKTTPECSKKYWQTLGANKFKHLHF